jgi:hypothetical protein
VRLSFLAAFCAISFVLAKATAAPAEKAPERLQATKPFVPTEGYEQRTIEGWKVHVNRELLEARAELGLRAMELLRIKLKNVQEVVPAGALAALQKVPIWLGVDDYAAPNACYHPSADWLRRHGWNPDKAGAVEIGNAAIFIDWSRTQPMMVLHELAHAYHHQVLGHRNAGIRASFERARASGLYDSVKHVNGRMQRAYALNNDQEFFAEMSEAFFGRNDFFPFTRDELKEHDPETFKMIETLWNQ